MVAWWLRALWVFNLLCLLVWSAWALPRSPWLAALGVLVAMQLGRIWLGLQFGLMQWIKRHRGLTCARASTVLRAWNAETHASARCFVWQMPWREHAEPDCLSGAALGQRGVVLVHGWLCNRAVWNDAMRELRARNVPFIAVSLPLLLHRIENARDTVGAAMQQMHAATGVAPLVVAHSMGGLVVRDWLRSLPQAADAIASDVITVGSPHHGAIFAHCVVSANATQMRPRSAWLLQLQADEAREGSPFSRVRWHCAFSDCDNVVFPESTACLEASQTLMLAGYAHVQMLAAPELWARVQFLLSLRK